MRFPTTLPLLVAAATTLSACSERTSLPVAPAATIRSSIEEQVARSETEAYTTIDVPGGTFVAALDINSEGVIVGRYRRIVDGQTFGFLRSTNAELTTIQFPGAVFTVAGGINNQGDIVGHYRLPSEPNTVRHGYLLRNGLFTSFDPPGSRWTNVLGINEHGDIVGRFCILAACPPPGSGVYRGFLLSGGEFTTIDYPGANETNLWTLNSSGEIVGGFGTPDGKGHLFVLRKGDFTAIELPGVVDMNQDKGGINSQGDIVGVYCDVAPCTLAPTGTHGFLLSGDDLTTIDVPGALATVTFGINARRDIVGAYYDATGQAHGFLLSGPGS